MSNIKYGLISDIDSNSIENVLDLACDTFKDEIIKYCEIGLYNGRTTSGVNEYLMQKGVEYSLVGIDNFKDKEELVFFPKNASLIVGSSIEIYNRLYENSQHVINIDGNHSFPYVIADFFCYKNKLKVGGIMMFHDAAPHAQNKSYQRMGSEDDTDMYISVLKSLEAIGLLDEKRAADLGFELLFHRWAPFEVDEGGGMIAFKRIK